MLQAPVSLSNTHVLDDFDCGVVSLNDWLKRRASNFFALALNKASLYIAASCQVRYAGRGN